MLRFKIKKIILQISDNQGKILLKLWTTFPSRYQMPVSGFRLFYRIQLNILQLQKALFLLFPDVNISEFYLFSLYLEANGTFGDVYICSCILEYPVDKYLD